MALKIALKPDEKVVINGAVIQNTDRRTNLIIHNKSAILREKDIITFEMATTPVRRIYFAIMMLYLDGSDEQVYYKEFVQRVSEFINVISNEDALEKSVSVIEAVNNKDYYGAILLCKKLLKFEEERLNYAQQLAESVMSQEHADTMEAQSRLTLGEDVVIGDDEED